MSYDAIRDALKTRLDALAGLGPVYTYERYIRDHPEATAFKNVFVETGVLNFAWIDRRAFRDLPVDNSDTRSRRQHEIEIMVFLALNDAGASGKTFQDRLETIANDLRTGDRTLGGACITHSLARVSSIGLKDFAGIPAVHGASINFTVEEVLG